MGLLSKLAKVAGVILAYELLHYVQRLVTSRLTTKKPTRREKFVQKLKDEFYDETEEKEGEFIKILMFPDPGMTCDRNMAGKTCHNPNCVAVHKYTSLAILVKMIGLAKHSVHVSMYLFTSNALGDALIKIHEEGVIVRVITDDRNSGEMPGVSAGGAQMGKLREAGIAVVAHASSFWMHHKYMVIDNMVVATGSFNWTNGGAMGNFENCILSTEPKLVNAFNKEFRKLWLRFRPSCVL